MTNPVAILRHNSRYSTDEKLQDAVYFWCPGCDQMHRVQVHTEGVPDDAEHTWDWNGKFDETITVSPSILCHSTIHFCKDNDVLEECLDLNFESCGHKAHSKVDGKSYVFIRHGQDPAYGNCHSYLENGKWRFLGDSAHSLAGQENVPMVPLPDWMVQD